MPNISAHMIVASEVGKILGINTYDYYRGNLLPDIIKKEDSHHRIIEGLYCIPDINYFINNLDLSKDINIGYLVHILLDYHYLHDYMIKMYPDRNVFIEPDKSLYHDYDYLNYDLVTKFNLDIDYLSKALAYFPMKVDKKKLKKNVDFLKQNTIGKTKYLDLDSFSKFLSSVSIIISEEMREYVNKYRNMHVRIR